MFDPFSVLTVEEIDDYVKEVIRCAPRRFVLFGYTAGRIDMGVIGWGLDWGDCAMFLTDGNDLVRSTSAEAVRDRFAIVGEVQLEFLDPEPPDLDAEAEQAVIDDEIAMAARRAAEVAASVSEPPESAQRDNDTDPARRRRKE